MTQVREVRFVVVSDDSEAAARLYRDVFGLEVVMDLDGQGGRGVILRLPTATLELVDGDHDAYVDELEVGTAQGNRLRIAVKVDELEAAGAEAGAAGAVALAAPVATPWGDRNQRLVGPGGLQLTLWQAP